MAHALLSPSSAHRWLHCTASPRLEEGVEDKGSEFAAEGSLAHAMGALKLKAFFGMDASHERQEIDMLRRYHTGEMDEYTDTYKTIVLEKYNTAQRKCEDAQLLVETRLDFGDYIPDAFGTGDAIIIADGTLDVIDFKYGKGVRVSAHKNPQMMIYALGAYERFSFEYNIKKVRMTIVQPRIDNLSDFEMDVKDLLAWAKETLAPKAKEAFKGDGPQNPGEWCQFCKVKSCCKALTKKCTDVVKNHEDPRLISAEELATDILPMVATVKTWLAGVEDYALQQAMSGVTLPGWKVVEGRSIRKITNQEGVEKALTEAGFDYDDIYKPLELRTITDLEKLAGKKQFNTLCGEFIEKPQGKPTLAPESDKRPALDTIADDFKNIFV